MLFQRRNNQKNKNPDFLIFRESGFFYSFTYIRNKNIRLSPQVGFEPTTNRLTADRSTPELLRKIKYSHLRIIIRVVYLCPVFFKL